MKKMSEVMAASGASKDEISSKLTGKVEEFQGQKQNPAIEYSFDPQQYENVAEAKQSSDWLNDNDILKTVNAALFTAAKAKAYQAATKSLKEAYEKSSDYKKAQFIKAAVAAGFSNDEAEAMAVSKLG